MLGVSNTDGIFLNETKYGKEIKQAYYRVKQREFCYNPYRVNVGSIGLNEFDYDNQIISGAYNVFGTDESELIPEYLMALFGSPQFLEYVNDKAHGGVRMNFKYEYLEDWEIPLPDIDMQLSLNEEIDSNLSVIKHINALKASFRFDCSLFPDCNSVLLGDIARIERGKFAHRPRNDPQFYHGDYPFIQINDITNDIKFISTHEQTLNKKGFTVSKMFPKGTLVMSIASSIGEVGILTFDSCFPDSIVAINPYDENVCLDYLFWYFKCFKGDLISMASQAIQKNINVQKLKMYPIKLPDINTQKKIINFLDDQLANFESLDRLKKNASIRLNKLVECCWNGKE